MVNSAGIEHPLGVLISLFSADVFPGGSSPKAFKLRQRDLTPAAERLEFVLDYTADLSGTTFGKIFQDTDFNEQFRDPWLKASWNQVAHFLQAAGLGYDPGTYISRFRKAASILAKINGVEITYPNTLSDEEVALRLITGHEKVGDSEFVNFKLLKSPSTALSRVIQQYGAATHQDVERFLLANSADELGNYTERDCLLRQIIPGLPDIPDPYVYRHRIGNSLQDLRLSVKGWRFGKMVKDKRITTLNEASMWIGNNLK
jgi:hypothetical protein